MTPIFRIRRQFLIYFLFVSHLFRDDLQEAQLSQRGRAMRSVIEHFPKSLKVTRGHPK